MFRADLPDFPKFLEHPMCLTDNRNNTPLVIFGLVDHQLATIKITPKDLDPLVAFLNTFNEDLK